MASLKVKRLKQETVGNKQEVVGTDLGEESLQAGAPTKADLGRDSPPLGRPPTYKRRGRASSSRHTSFYL